MPTDNLTTKNPEVFKVFDASTGHITKKDDELLKDNSNFHPLIVYPYECGYFVYVFYPEPEDLQRHLESMKEYGFSQEFINLFEIATKSGSKFLCLDCDGPVYTDLTSIFTW